LCARAITKGIDLFKIVQAACINPVLHYKMRVGLLREGDPADFIFVDSAANFRVLQTYIDGNLVAKEGSTMIATSPVRKINKFSCEKKSPEMFRIPVSGSGPVPVIEALDGQLITNRIDFSLDGSGGFYESDVTNDILKIVVVNRYKNAPVAKSFIKNFNLKKGAIASSVAHDSHNIVAVGVDDESICRAVNLVIREEGGLSCVLEKEEMVLGLPVGGLMSAGDGFEAARQYTMIDAMARRAGSTLSAPFMTLSFMALLVIPHLKLSDKGLFNGDRFAFESFGVEEKV
jgi:adenine deaminase